MSLYYQDELNLKEIGEVLGVSESRVSQILSSNVKKLRNISDPFIEIIIIDGKKINILVIT